MNRPPALALAALLAATPPSLPAAPGGAAEATPAASSRTHQEISNRSYRLTVTCSENGVEASLDDALLGPRVAEGPCLYQAARRGLDGVMVSRRLEKASVSAQGNTLTIRGELAGLSLEHRFVLSGDRPVMEERIILRNNTPALIALSDFEAGLQRRVTDADGQVIAELQNDRWVAFPCAPGRRTPRGT